ncbi:hypothetical protein CEP54_001270 [Fusarium duplospermum]|uniref:RanBP2-type domain-containing protein n=1 Tax=Fusarium duplospermum TaxID=1325734 RepID=A0A428R1V5_9HYPO|nr:hypothetical protein CEP54_001270 [Fusarium duplospermum]
MPTTVTNIVRDDHTKWRCQHCQKINDMGVTHCTRCNKKRSIGAQAINQENSMIGELQITNTAGDEFWEYGDYIEVIHERYA